MLTQFGFNKALTQLTKFPTNQLRAHIFAIKYSKHIIKNWSYSFRRIKTNLGKKNIE